MIYRRYFNIPTWRFRSPLDELHRMRNHLDRMFEGYSDSHQNLRSGVFPLINLSEDKEGYFVRAELPGVKADELDIQVTANNLSITGERKIAVEDENAKYHRKEREAGTFSRMIELPGEVDTEKVDAGLVNGILTIRIPKAEVAKPRQITVNS